MMNLFFYILDLAWKQYHMVMELFNHGQKNLSYNSKNCIGEKTLDDKKKELFKFDMQNDEIKF